MVVTRITCMAPSTFNLFVIIKQDAAAIIRPVTAFDPTGKSVTLAGKFTSVLSSV